MSEQAIPMAGQGQKGPADPRAAERLKRRLRIIENMKRIKHKFIVASGKGGVGKSTVATHLAVALSKQGHRVGLLDMDLTGPNIPTMLGIRDAEVHQSEGGLVPVRVNENLSVISMQFLLPSPDEAIVWRGPIKMQIIGQFLGDVDWGELDYLIVDLPPGSSDEPLSVAQNIPDADGMVLVTTPQEVAVGDVRKSIAFGRKLEMPILGVIENMAGLVVEGVAAPGSRVVLRAGGHESTATADGEGHFTTTIDIFTPGGGEAMAHAMEVPFLGRLPFDPRINREADHGRLVAFAAEDVTGQAIEGVVARLLQAQADAGDPGDRS